MAKVECEKVDNELDEVLSDDSDAACSLYDQLLIHYVDMMSTKEEKEKGHIDTLNVVCWLTGQYASQVC